MEIRLSTMGFPILVRWHLHIESGPCEWPHDRKLKLPLSFSDPAESSIKQSVWPGELGLRAIRIRVNTKGVTMAWGINPCPWGNTPRSTPDTLTYEWGSEATQPHSEYNWCEYECWNIHLTCMNRILKCGVEIHYNCMDIYHQRPGYK